MFQSFVALCRGSISLLLYGINTVLLVPPLMMVAMFKWLIPFAGWRTLCDRMLNGIAAFWVSINNWNIHHIHRVRWDITGLENLSPDQWYMVLANHQSWVDILVLQAIFHKRIPFLKFFLKKELIWVPFLGLAWWALDFLFMRRHSPEYLEQHPEKRGEDLDVTRRACEKFRLIPTSVMNFVEGTRFTERKHAAFKSPYRHLLPPRPGGTSFVLSAMGGMLHSMLDVTIAYTGRTPSFWDLCCGRLGTVTVDIRRRAIDERLAAGDYAGDPAFRARFKEWLAGIWTEKDQLLDRLGT